MDKYISPYTITNTMLEYVSSIMEKIGKLDNYTNYEKMPNLRRNNRIKSIHSSLAIEANSLSLDQVKAVISGKSVIGPEKEIQEVLNAYKAYEIINDLNPYSIKDLKRVHKVLTDKTIELSGTFRTGNEGVFDGAGNCIHVCPPPEQLDYLMKQLFDWMKKNKDEIHPLILSSIFHYEFVFIHPFCDGNGRTARLWQNVLLTNWKSFFEYLPIESQIKKYQEEYYTAISNCHKSVNSNEFIEFMLKMIDKVLKELLETPSIQLTEKSVNINKLLSVMEYGVPMTANEIMEKLEIKSKETLRSTYLDPAIEEGVVELTIPDKPTSKNQMYYKV
jgi:Fic family protein